MNKILFLLGLSFNMLTYTYSQNIYDSIYVGGYWRTFLTHLPTGYGASNQVPLVLAFHGGGPMGYPSIQYQSRLTAKSDSVGFILVYPEGVKIAGNRTWNAGGCCAPSTTLNIDDIAFTDALLDHLIVNYAVDTTRVYATGFSNGALLCYRLANQLTNRFAAIAPVAGNLMYYPWNPSRAIPIISFHSYQDQNVKYFGGVTVGSTGTYFPPQDSVLQLIGTNYTCSVLKDTLYQNFSQYDHFKYSNCACNAIIEQYVSHDGEHSWPGGLASPGVNVSSQFSATFLMWEFFQNYSMNCQTSNKEETFLKDILIYPNPFSDRIYISDVFEYDYFKLLTAQGNVVWEGNQLKEIDFSFLPDGIYLLKVREMVVKLIKD
jgi:polyhydroxybutyrate depolymerase